jgi:oligoendopeptidase F
MFCVVHIIEESLSCPHFSFFILYNYSGCFVFEVAVYKIIKTGKVKVKFTLEVAMKAQKGRKLITLLFL